jgi:hypothetical protein
MTRENDLKIAQQRLGDRKWRLNNLYYIQNKQGEKQLFKMNWCQELLFNEMWYLNCVLKARQLGVSTFVTILFLDAAIFNSDVSCGIVADNEENAKYIFRKIKYAYDNLPEELKALRSARVDSAKEMTFTNNSLIRVGTSLRGSTFNYLLISEFGKVASEDLKRANEILTGTLNTLASGQFCFVESTSRGKSGAFFDLCKTAQDLKDSKIKLTPLDWKFFFFAWHLHPEYCLNSDVIIPSDLDEYFAELREVHGIALTRTQKAWYAKKYQTNFEDMKREFPSLASEAFEANVEGHYYSKYLTKAREEGRIGNVAHDENLPVFVSIDLGFSDSTSVWFYQVVGQEVHLIDFYENSGEPLPHYLKILRDKPYNIQKFFVPHDATTTEYGSGLTRVQIARNHGITFTVLPKLSLQEGIDNVRSIFGKFWFDSKRCGEGIRSLDAYRKSWDATHGCWRDNPVHDFSSHAADSFRYLAQSLRHSRPQQDVGYISPNRGFMNPMQSIRHYSGGKTSIF